MKLSVVIGDIEIKVEDDDSEDALDGNGNADGKAIAEPFDPEDTVEFTVSYEDIDDHNGDTIYSEDTEYDKANEHENDNFEHNDRSDGDDSEDYNPDNKDAVNVRRKFKNKPPVITERRRRGRPRKVVVPKKDTEDM